MSSVIENGIVPAGVLALAPGARHRVHIKASAQEAGEVVAMLARSSVEFTFDPYPADEWEVTVKADQRQTLINAINIVSLINLAGWASRSAQYTKPREPGEISLDETCEATLAKWGKQAYEIVFDCQYGHLDCSYRNAGPCMNEENARQAGIIARAEGWTPAP